MTFPATASMDEVRAGIDAVDRQLVALLAERMHYIVEATRHKQGPEEALVLWRVEDVATKVRVRASEVGFDPDRAEALWRLIMAECIAFEEEFMKQRPSRKEGVAS